MDTFTVRSVTEADFPDMCAIWNEIVEEGAAFPQEEPLDEVSGPDFFLSQSFCGVAEGVEGLLGLYILHPNNVGRCGHICNASYAVSARFRGRGVGEQLVRHCLEQARRLGFRILQFNAVVESNLRARRLYERLGFQPLGVIPGGFRCKDGRFEDIRPYYFALC